MVSKFIQEKDFIIFNSAKSSDLGLVLLKMPEPCRAKERSETIIIPGKNGVMHERDGSFENYTMEASLFISDESFIEKICDVFQGFGELILSTDISKKYKVYIKNQVDINFVSRRFRNILLQFDTYPFKFSSNEVNDFIESSSAFTVYNPSSLDSEPIIKIFGSGNVTLIINDRSFEIENISEYITINSEILEIYKNNENQNGKYMSLEFPKFTPGENNISWSGRVQKIEIEPKWRWL